jgi:TPR repeat protein
LDCDEKLFPGVDMVDYRLYRDRVFESTYQSPNARVVFLNEMVQAKDTPIFEAAKAEADGGNAQKQVTVARMYQRGQGVKANANESFRYYEMAARQREPIGMYQTGLAYFLGNGVARDLRQAAQWLAEAAKEPNFVQAQVQLALFLENGWGGPPDGPRAVALLKKAADPPSNFRDAQYHLGRILCDGKVVAANHAEARRYYEMALANGEEGAGNDLASMDIKGQGKAIDFPGALKTFQAAMDRDLPMACFNLGLIYSGGFPGQPQDIINPQRAKECYEKGAALGDPNSMVKLAVIFVRASANEASAPQKVKLEAEAARYFKRASELGNLIATHNYGKMKVEGKGGPVDYKEGIEHLILAAEKGVWQSMQKLAEMLRAGLGFKADPDLAARLEQRMNEIRTRGPRPV